MHVNTLNLLEDPFEVIRGEQIPAYTVTFKQFRGGKPADFITTSWVVLKLVSAKVIDLKD